MAPLIEARGYMAFGIGLLTSTTTGGRFFGGGCLDGFAGSTAGRREPAKGLPRKIRPRLAHVSHALIWGGSSASNVALSREDIFG
jgi:hypothetical protein